MPAMESFTLVALPSSTSGPGVGASDDGPSAEASGVGAGGEETVGPSTDSVGLFPV